MILKTQICTIKTMMMTTKNRNVVLK